MEYLRVYECPRPRPDGSIVMEPYIEMPWYPVQEFNLGFLRAMAATRSGFVTFDEELDLYTLACMNGYAVYAGGSAAVPEAATRMYYLIRGEQDTLEPIPL